MTGSRRITVFAAVASLLCVGVVALDRPAASAATPGIAVTKQGPSSVLIGQPVTYTLTASNPTSNPGVAPEYNLSFRDVLPVGVTYQAGSTSSADLGEPSITTNATTGQQTLLWVNVSDLLRGGSQSLTFSAIPDTTALPVGSTFTNTGEGYASTSPRTVPKFAADGTPVADGAVQSATSAPVTTIVSPLSVSKAEPSPESKLLRGAHDQTTVYTLTVSSGDVAPNDDVIVTDYLPASLEFLGCGGVDNSAGPEYPGAASLTATPVIAANCPTPESVATVTNPPPDGGVTYPAGVYTKVTWDLGNQLPDAVTTIQYAAAIPLRQNAAFGTGGPTPTSLEQAANLDNNTGASTRQVGTAAGVTNYVHVSGSYQGPVEVGTPTDVVADSSHTVTANDLRIIKSVSPAAFSTGDIATYTLEIDAGEYNDMSALTVTDTLPNGVCPIDDTTNYVTGSPIDCRPVAGNAPTDPYQSVTQNPDGTFTVVFKPLTLAHNGSTTITYHARMRQNYTGGSLAGTPTAAGDSFTNNVTEVATSSPRAGTGEIGPVSVTDSSSATQTSSAATLTKEIQSRVVPQNCSANTYVIPRALPVPATSFRKGDRVCFELTVQFPDANATRNPILVDFLPQGTEYEDGSYVPGPDNTVDPAQVDFDESTATQGALSWTLGESEPDGSLSIAKGEVFQARFSVTVTDPAAGPAPDVTGNIAKLRTENSAGQAQSLRAVAAFSLLAVPPVSILKGVGSVNGVPAGLNPPDTDGVQVGEGDKVVFRVDLTNNGSLLNFNNYAVQSIVVWDALAAGITCADVPAAAISNGGVCTDPGDAGQPTFAGNATRSAIVWPGSAAATLAAGASTTYTYEVDIPAGTSVTTTFTDTASVQSYQADTNVTGRTSTSYPADNVDTTVDPATEDVPAASDDSNVFLPAVGVAKGVQSAISEAGNVGLEATPSATTQATIGEQVTWTVTARLPAHATVYGGKLVDPLPAGFSLVSATAGWTADASLPPTGALPPGASFDSSTMTLTLPTPVDNASTTDQLYALTITGQVINTNASIKAGVTLPNTATFTSTTGPAGGTTPPPVTAGATVKIVEPQPVLAKTNDSPATGTSGGSLVTFTLKASNAAGSSLLHAGWVVDCVPAGLTFVAYGTPSTGSTVAPEAGTGTDGCAPGTTRLAWNVGDLTPGAAAATLTYTATVDPNAPGKAVYTNTAALTGDSLAGARTGPTDPGSSAGRLYTAGATSQVTVAGADITKTATPLHPTIGQTVTYTVTTTIPSNVTFYNFSMIDAPPTGIDPNSATLISLACVNADLTACSPSTATVLTAATGPARIGWLLGNVAASSQVRTVTLIYTATVADVPAAARGVALTNGINTAWDLTATTPPSSAGATFDKTGTVAHATVTVAEPLIAIAKSVDKATPAPGDTFHYTLAVSNSAGVNFSTAYGVAVTDTVPTGVVVDPATISNGGTIAGADPTTGGGVISWALASVAPGASTSLTYAASLAPSATLTAAALTNTARVTGYTSLPGAGRNYTGTSTTAKVTPAFPKVVTVKSTPNGTTAQIGQPFTWRVTTTNQGGSTAYAVAVTDSLPINWTYDTGSATVSVAGGPSAPIEPVVTTAGNVQTLTWTGLATLPAGTAAVITYTATPTSAVITTPGIGLGVNQTNTAGATAQDVTGATGNKSGQYTGGPTTAVAHIASADLSIVKAVGVQPTAGGTGTWTLTVKNLGPDTAAGPFTVTDDFTTALPTGVSAVTASGTGWQCTTGAPISCQRSAPADTLASGASFPPITVGYSVAPDVTNGTALTNTATVAAATDDPVLSNNTSTANTTVVTSADLAIKKTLTSPQLVPGSLATYNIAVTNLGPSVSLGPITISDPLPAGTAFDSLSAPGWTCDPITAGTVGATLHCVHAATLVVGESAAVTVTVTIPSSQTAAVTNTASITSVSTPDPVSANNTSTTTNTPVISADLALQKHHIGTVVPGTPAAYQMDVHNNGPSDAADATVVDILPAPLGFLASGDAAWSCSAVGQKVTCVHAAPIAAGATSTFTLNVSVASSAPASITNVAVVSSTSPDPDLTNNVGTDNTGTTGQADLSIAKSHSGNGTAGSPIDFALTVTNNGPSDEQGDVTVVDTLPAGLLWTATSSATGTGWTCDGAVGSQLVTCTGANGLVAHSSAPVITVHVTIDPAAAPSTLINEASVTGTVFDPDLSNNTTSDSLVVGVSSDISLTKTLTSASPVTAGGSASFELVASNDGPSDATGITVTDTLPNHLTYVSASGTGWTCTNSGQTVLCSRDSLEAVPPGNATPPIELDTTVDPSTPITPPGSTTTLTNSATVTAASPSFTSPPATADVDVIAHADLELAKAARPSTASAGEQTVWNIDVTNDGPSDAAAPLTVTDDLPAYETYVSVEAPWTCTPGPVPAAPTDQQSISCQLAAALPATGTAPTLAVTVQLDAAAPAGVHTNSATVTSPTPGTPGTGSGDLTVTRSAVLSLSKTHTGTASVGDQLTYALIAHNAGPAVADDLVIDDPLAPGLTYVSGTGTGWTCVAAGTGAHCELAGNVGVGEDTSPLSLVVEVGPAAYPSVTNVATVSSTDPDLPGSATATDVAPVPPLATLSITKHHIGTFAVGGPGTYRLTVTNNGPTPSPGPIVVTDSLPAGLTYVSAAGPGWTCAAVAAAVTCTLPTGLALDASSTITLHVTIGSAAYPSVVNTATAAGPGSPTVSGTDTAPVMPLVVLHGHKELLSSSSTTAKWKITVTNAGPQASVEPIVVTDQLDPGLTYSSASGSGWSCQAAGQLVTCVRDATLAVGATSSIVVVTNIVATGGTVIPNVATITGGGSKGPVKTNTATVTVPESTSGGLPFTGFDAAGLVALACLLMLTGGAATWLARRRRP
jgi:large repetitive protein